MSYSRTYPRRSSGSSFGCIAILAVVALFLIGGFILFLDYRSESVVTCTVTEKDRTKNSDGGSDARIYTEQCGVLKVGDSLVKWRWNSADVYASIQPNHTYRFTKFGWRIPFLSTFPNILKVEQVS